MLFSLFFFMTIAILCVSYKFKPPPKVQKFLTLMLYVHIVHIWWTEFLILRCFSKNQCKWELRIR